MCAGSERVVCRTIPQCARSATPLCVGTFEQGTVTIATSVLQLGGAPPPDCGLITFSPAVFFGGAAGGGGDKEAGCWGVAAACLSAALAGRDLTDVRALEAYATSPEFKAVQCACTAATLSCFASTDCTPSVSPFLAEITVALAVACPASGSAVSGSVVAIGSVVVAVAASVATQATGAAGESPCGTRDWLRSFVFSQVCIWSAFVSCLETVCSE